MQNSAKNQKKIIILDTNILIHCIKFKIDIESELRRILPFNFETCILDNTLTEMKFLEDKKETKLISKILQQLVKKFKVIQSPKAKVDDSLVALANENTIIATQDREIKKQIKTPIIIIRSRNHLELMNYINY